MEYSAKEQPLRSNTHKTRHPFKKKILGDANLTAHVKRGGAQITILADIVDDIIDRRPISNEEKKAILACAKNSLFGKEPERTHDQQENATYRFAQEIFREHLREDHEGRMQHTFHHLLEAVHAQFTERDEQKLLDIGRNIGTYCIDVYVALADIATKTTEPDTQKAIHCLGAYGLFLDHLCEIDDDLAEGVHTYPTIRISKEGDTPEVRRSIKEEMLDIANDIIEEGHSYLASERQRTIYRAVQGLLDVKYRIPMRTREIFAKSPTMIFDMGKSV